MANKFKGILFCSDLDGTMLTSSDRHLTKENRDAIEYFMSEGGYFTLATGRAPLGTRPVLDIITPNVPYMICLNGVSIYNFDEDSISWGVTLDKSVIRVIEYVEKMFPEAGIEVFTDKSVYFSKENEYTDIHRHDEALPHIIQDYHNIYSTWRKVLFAWRPDMIAKFGSFIANSPYADKFHFVQSEATYFEILPKNTSKGAALPELAKLLKTDIHHTIAIGDNYNDLELVKNAGFGIAVANAVREVREAADMVTVDNNSNAIAAVISSLDLGIIKLH